MSKKTDKPLLAWHFLSEDGRLRYGDNRKPRKGVAYKANGDLELCENGMHASIGILDAVGYAPGPILCRVEMIGETLRGDDKVCSRGRKIIAQSDVSKTLHRFAVTCAMRALRGVENPDVRSLEACRIKLLWIDGKATDQELDAARDAAWVVALDAERKWQSKKLLSMLRKYHPELFSK